MKKYCCNLNWHILLLRSEVWVQCTFTVKGRYGGMDLDIISVGKIITPCSYIYKKTLLQVRTSVSLSSFLIKQYVYISMMKVICVLTLLPVILKVWAVWKISLLRIGKLSRGSPPRMLLAMWLHWRYFYSKNSDTVKTEMHQE